AALRTGAGAGLGGAGAAATWSLAAPGADLADVLGRELAALPRNVQQVALAGDEGTTLAVPAADAREAATAGAREAGWIRRADDRGLEAASESHRGVALAALATPALAELAARAAKQLPRDDPRRATALAAAGRGSEAAAL